MKRALGALVFCLLSVRVAAADEVKVRLFAAHPPNSIEILATSGLLRWKNCASCAEKEGPRLLIDSAGMGGGHGSDTPSEFFVSGRYELRAANAPSIFLEFPLEVRPRDGVLNIVVAMPLEAYVAHVLMAESGDFKNAEAMKAMAVAVRTYATRFLGQHRKEGFDFCDTTHCQVYRWREPNDRVRAAVGSTAATTLNYRGLAAATYYHQNCGGTIAAADEAWSQVSEDYLPLHADPFCVVSGGLKWESSLTREQIDRALRASGIGPPQNWQEIVIRSRTKSGRVQTILLDVGDAQKFSVSGSSFRFAMNRAWGWGKIRSDLYDVRNLGEKFLFSGRGGGHGVGLCQAGAEEMARQGKSYREILSFYFPGADPTESPNSRRASESWQKVSDERFDLVSVHPGGDAEVLPLAERMLRESENAVDWKLPYRPRLQVYATLNGYRDATGEPGWVAASTRGYTIRLQPLAELRRRAVLESTLRHELTHLLVEARAKNGTAIWFREGLTLYLSGEADGAGSGLAPLPPGRIDAILANGDTQESTRRAYQSAHKIVRSLVQKYGKEEVLGWLGSGMPRNAVADADAVSVQSPGE